MRSGSARKRTVGDAPFYCGIKGCRKSAWETPEHMSEGDWTLLARLRDVTTAAEFCAMVFESRVSAESCFWRILGWPEGMAYMRDETYAEETGWPALTNHGLKRALEALSRYELATAAASVCRVMARSASEGGESAQVAA